MNNQHHSCLSYISSFLRAAGTRVEYPGQEEPSAEAPTPDHGEPCEKGLLQLRNLDTALTSLQKIDALHRQHREPSDRVGTSLARELVAKSQDRTRSVAANARLGPEKREIAKWFKVWLKVPDLFYDWLEVCQKSREFRRMFPHFNGRTWHLVGKRSFSI